VRHRCNQIGRRNLARFFPGACKSPFLGDSFLAFSTSSSNLAFGTEITPRMTSLKWRNSGVASKVGSFITLPKRACACRAPASSCLSRTHLWLKLHFASQFPVGNPASNNLFHSRDNRERLFLGEGHASFRDPWGLREAA